MLDDRLRADIVPIIFNSANFVSKEQDIQTIQKAGASLVRFEFYETLVRLADAKYFKQGPDKTISDAFRRLIKDDLSIGL